MFTHHVIMQLKANSAAEFTNTMERKVLPLLRKQKGFRDEVTSISRDNTEAIAISFWDTKEDAEAYNLAGYPQVFDTLSKVVEGIPHAGTPVISNSTIH